MSKQPVEKAITLKIIASMIYMLGYYILEHHRGRNLGDEPLENWREIGRDAGVCR